MIEVQTKIDKNVKLAASRQSILYYSYLLAFVMAAISGTGIIILISNLQKTVGISLIIAGILAPLFVIGVSYLAIVIRISKANDEECNTQTLKFGDKILLSEQSQEKEPTESEVDYSQVLKATETNEYFILFLNAFALIMVSKNGFLNGTEQSLRTLLKENLGKKFNIHF